jgi:hypothetical protein
MVKNDTITHQESSSNPWYTAEGAAAGREGNVYLGGRAPSSAKAPIHFWMLGPFHELGIINPKLSQSGYGDYTENIGNAHFGATLNVLSHQDQTVRPEQFPVIYPADGRILPDLAFTGGESPDPLVACSGYSAPTGPPIAIQLGKGDVTPNVRSSTIEHDGQALDHCRFDQKSYPAGVGRQILQGRSAIILMTKQPLQANSEYHVTLDTNGNVYTWSFQTGDGRVTQSASAPSLGEPPRE